MKQTEELKRSAFRLSLAAEANGQGNVRWRSAEYVTLSGALAVLASYKAELIAKIDDGIASRKRLKEVYAYNNAGVAGHECEGELKALIIIKALLEDNPTEKK